MAMPMEQKEKTVEKSVVLCKICNTEKERILVGKYNYKDKKWVDADNNAFNGKVCPPCYKKQVADRMRLLREKRKAASTTFSS